MAVERIKTLEMQIHLNMFSKRSKTIYYQIMIFPTKFPGKREHSEHLQTKTFKNLDTDFTPFIKTNLE